MENLEWIGMSLSVVDPNKTSILFMVIVLLVDLSLVLIFDTITPISECIVVYTASVFSDTLITFFM